MPDVRTGVEDTRAGQVLAYQPIHFESTGQRALPRWLRRVRSANPISLPPPFDPPKEAYWREVIERQASSGLSMREYCRREGMAETSLHAWRRTIARRE